VIFNININSLLLLVLIYIINTLILILITYYFIKLELAEVFICINIYIRELFFYNNYYRLGILLSDFATNLIIIIIIKKNINILILLKDYISYYIK